MRRSLILLLMAMTPLSAQWRHFGPRTHATGFVGIGVSAPVNPLARGLDTGWNIAGGGGVTNQYLGIMIDGVYSDFGVTRSALQRAGAHSGNQKFFAFTLDPVFHVNEHGPVDFYVTGGFGLYGLYTHYHASTGVPGPGGSRYELSVSDTLFKPGVNGGAGFSFGMPESSHIRMFVEARFHHMFTNGPEVSFIPVTVGVRF